MKFNYPINNFSSGEWSPKMKGRTDVDQYPKACEILKNAIPQMSGGASYRPGTKWKEIKNSTTQSYLDALLAGDTVIDMKILSYLPYNALYRNILCITGAAKWYTLPNGTEISYGTNVAAAADLNQWTPSETKHVLIGDLLFLVNGNGSHKPKVFYYNTASSVWKLDDIDGDYVATKPWKTIPWGPINALDSNVTMNPSGTTGPITLTASASFFVGAMVGTYIRLCNGTSLDGVIKITAVSSGTSATATVLQTLPTSAFAFGATANPNSFWQISEWNDYYGWPRTVAAFQGRVIYGGNSSKPDTIWGSRIGNVFDMEEVPAPNTTGTYGFASGAYTADNSRPFALAQNSNESSNIYALSSAKTLVINTDRAEIVAYGSNGALGPVNVVFESSTSFGAERVQPIRLNNYLTFVQKGGRKVRDMIFNFDENQFKSNDLAFVSDHLFLLDGAYKDIDQIKEMVSTENQSSILWVRTKSGQVYGVTLDRDYQVNAWFRCELGHDSSYSPQFYNGGYPAVMSLCTYPESDNNYSSLYMLTIRKYGGSNHVVLENLQALWELGNPFNTSFSASAVPPIDGNYPIYLDNAQVINKSGSLATLTFNTAGSYSNPYRNTKVHVVADGNYLGEYQVANDATGTLTLNTGEEANTIVVGYLYEGIIKTMPIEQGGQAGVPMGRQKRLDEVVIRFYETGSAKFGKDENGALDEITIRQATDPMNQGIPYFTGDKVVRFPNGYERQCQVVIKQDKPYPMHVIAIVPRGVTYD